MRFPLLVASLVLALGLSPTLATELVDSDFAQDIECGVVPAAIGFLPGEAAWQYFVSDECAAHEEALAARLDALLRAGAWPDDRDSETINYFARRIRESQLRFTLARKDLSAAGDLIAELDVIAARDAAQFAARFDRALLEDEAEPEQRDAVDETIDTRRLELESQWLGVVSVLEGIAPPQRSAIPAPSRNWMLFFGGCGTPRVEYVWTARRRPDVADAWLARGRVDVALQELLAAQWVEAISLGVPPPRLREFADRALGAGAYEREVRIALEAIRVEDGPDGRSASMPMLGLALPLPVGIHSWRDENPDEFENAIEVADFLRGVLLDEWPAQK